MSKITGNQMTMAHFHDFYFLEALQARLNMAKSTNPEFQFRHSVERLERDINETFEKLTHSMALRIYVYLYAASLGEARHASDNCEMIIEEIDTEGRNSVYTKALKFFPNDENVQILTDVFEQDWSSVGFGGRAWLQIVEAMKLYGKITDAAFIDHAVDLEHNSGSVFTKNTADEINFQCFGDYDANSLRGFLNYKFSADILQEQKWTREFAVSTKVYNLIVRFSNVVENIKAVDFCNPELEFLTPYTIEWGYDTFTRGEGDPEADWPECDWCSNKIDPDDHFHYNDACICDSCYEDLPVCDKCGEVCKETTTVDGDEWCEDCVMNYAACCEDCGCYTEEWTTTDDTNQTFCNDCIENNATKCEECDEWYSDIEEHNESEQPTYDTPLTVDADGVFEIMPEYLETKVTIIYKWQEHGMAHEIETTTPMKQIADLKQSGAIMAKIKKELPYVKTIKTFKEMEHTETQTVYDVPGSGLFVYEVSKNSFGVMTPSGLYTIGNDKTLDGAMETLYNIKDLIDWNTITTPKIWQSLPSETISKIRHAVYGG